MRLLKNATNIFGNVGPEVEARIQAFMDAPGYEAWDDICGIIMSWEKKCGCGGHGCNTVWQAVCAVDPTFQRSGKANAKTPRQRWHRFPDAMTVARAIKHATGG